MRVKSFARWAWVVLPVAIMLAFYGAILSSIKLGQIIFGGIDPRVFFYIPFLSLLPPLILFSIWYLQRNRSDASKLVITTERTLVWDVGIGLGLAAICIVTFVGSFTLLRWFSIPTPDLSSFNWTQHLFFATIGAIVPGIAEEIYFRGFLMQKFRDISPILLILITSLSFALWHVLSPAYLLHTFLIGLILGTTYHRTGRLLPVMLGHSLTNATAGLLIMNGYV